MNDSKIFKINRFLLYLTALIPILYLDNFFYPFVLLRTLFFRLIILIVFFLTLFLFLNSSSKYKIKFGILFYIFLMFVVGIIISSLFGYNFYKSFFSTFERLEGAVYWIFLLFYFILLRFNFKKEKNYNYFIKLVSVISFFVALYGVLQRYSILNLFHSGLSRVESTLGNAAFLGSYLFLTGSLSLFIFFKKEITKYRHLYVFISIFDFFVLILSLTRSSILALLVFIFCSFILLFIFHKKYRKKILLIFGIFLFLLAIFFISNSRGNFGNSFANRFSIRENASTKNRIFVWKKSLQEFQKFDIKSKILGVGHENFDYVFNKFYNPEINEKWFDRAHNIYIDLLITDGVVGLFLYIILLFFSLYFSLKLLFKLKKTEYIFIFSLFFGYIVNNFFVFDTINTSFIFIFLLSFLEYDFFIFSNSYQSFSDSDKSYSKINSNLKKYYKLILIFLLFFIIYLFWILVYLPFNINHKLYIGFSNVLNNKSLSYKCFTYLENHDFALNETSKQIYDSYQSLVDHKASPENRVKFFQIAEKSLWRAHFVYPKDIRISLYLSQLIINSYSDKDKIKPVESLLLEAEKLSPYRPEVYYLLAQVYVKLGDNDRAIKTIEKITKILPNFADAKFILANLLFKTNKEYAIQIFNSTLEKPYSPNQYNYKRIIEFLLNNKEYKRVIPYYLNLIKLEPNNCDYKIDLSRVYYLVGDLDKAIEQVNLIQEKEPDILKNYQEYLNVLYNKNFLVK